MNSSAAPTPVMPNTAIAMPMPEGGSSNRRPPATASHEKKRGIRISTTAASAVMTVNRPTLTIAIRSTRAYPPPRSSASVSARKMTTHAAMGTAGMRRCITCETPPYIAPTCNWVAATMSAQAHTSQFSCPARGPGM